MTVAEIVSHDDADRSSPLVKIALLIGGADDGGRVPGAAWSAGSPPGCRTGWARTASGPADEDQLFGLGQPLADGLKFIFKEEYTPAHVDQVSVHRWRRFRSLAAALAIFAVIPFGSVLPPCDIPGVEPIRSQLIVAPGVDVGHDLCLRPVRASPSTA